MENAVKVRRVIFLVIICIALIIGGAFRYLSSNLVNAPKTAVIREFLMDTLVEIQVEEHDQEKAVLAMDRMRSLALVFDPHSGDIARINDSFGPVHVSDEVYELLELVLAYSPVTQGGFNITIGSLIELWGFTEDTPSVPEAGVLAGVVSEIASFGFTLDPEEKTVAKSHPNMKIDVGGIAKGYIVDQAVLMLAEQGVQSALINAGGDLYVLGSRPQGHDWRIAVRHPRDLGGFLGTLKIKDCAVATSGDYQRFFIEDGRHYHHILDPATGMPANKCISVTILSNSVTLADMLATTVFVLGPDVGMSLVEGLENTEAIIVDQKGRVLLSSGIDSSHWPKQIEVAQ
ncbi:MAG: FAD:protein FMN transferase [Limnochordia bacterium]|nr:FAD:protein FMN transferase [Limnochordia bacterium]MDD2629644.1 FAD:protein FMN transferase [Limnochordia bacterium]MDD4517042.1 FAD:protein FMN transferase [Limnochordia bacterium]